MEGRMSKFMIMFKSDVSATEQMANATPKQIQASMQAWTQWKENLDATIGFDWGLPLQAVAEVTSNSVTEGSSTVSGYAIMEGDKQAITSILQSHPHLQFLGTSIDVLEMIHMSGV
jgi:hypothetical protein